jgi:uncharacterized repeat protein (TIGR01451 family)
MQKVFGTPVTNANKLNCTANDIRLSRALSVSPSSCIEGTTIDLTATFETIVTANARYDAGFFFRTDGGANARGDGTNATGTCSLSALTPGVSPALNLDGDTCGDLNAGTFQVTFTIPDVSCTGVPDPLDPSKKILKLPNCTSWHSNQGTACDISNPFSTSDASDFQPDTKSKCVCDDNFTVPVIVETASLTVVKTANPIEVPEPGQTVTYTVMVTNISSFVDVTITTLTDDIYGDLTALSTSCANLVGVVLQENGGTASCTFQALVSGDAGTVVTDIAEVCGTQQGSGATVCDDDDATVTITDVASTPTLTKDVIASATASCTLTVNVTYQVGISNPSTFDTLTVNSLTDNQFGNITQAQGSNCTAPCVVSTLCVPDSDPATCQVGGTIAPSNSCSCTFVGKITGGSVSGSSCTFSHADTVTGSVTDDDGHNTTPSDGATVNVSATVNVTVPVP